MPEPRSLNEHGHGASTFRSNARHRRTRLSAPILAPSNLHPCTGTLLFHSTNRKNPRVVPVDEETDDEDDDKEEYEVVAKPDAAKSNTATSGSSHAANINTGTGSSQQVSDVDESTGVTAPELPLGDQSTSESTVFTPPVKNFKRRRAPSNDVTFEERRPLRHISCVEVYKLFEKKFNADVVLTVGETTMTGGQLLEFLEEGQNALSIMNAFVQCVKSDDKTDETRSYHKNRIIIPTKDLVSFLQETKLWMSVKRSDSKAY